jgi:hypothetical protein
LQVKLKRQMLLKQKKLATKNSEPIKETARRVVSFLL